MPRKTKAEKIIARYRKEREGLLIQTTKSPSITLPQKTHTEIIKNKFSDSFQLELEKEKRYFQKDITRSFISIAFILIILVCITLFQSQLSFLSF